MVSLIVAGVPMVLGGVLVMRVGVTSGRWRIPERRHSAARDALAEHEFVEAVASFTEQMRDAVTGAAGLEQAIAQAAATSPDCIRPQLTRLVAGIRYGRIEDALRAFADELAHPTSDFVVAALLVAVRNETRDLGALLGHLSNAAREECRLQLRVWVSRTRLRSSVRTVTVSVALFALGLGVLNPSYLQPYVDPVGSLVLAVEVACFVVGIRLMRSMSGVQTPVRLLGGST